MSREHATFQTLYDALHDVKGMLASLNCSIPGPDELNWEHRRKVAEDLDTWLEEWDALTLQISRDITIQAAPGPYVAGPALARTTFDARCGYTRRPDSRCGKQRLSHGRAARSTHEGSCPARSRIRARGPA
jgi:hypothetical protein